MPVAYWIGVLVGISGGALALILYRKRLKKRVGAPVEGKREYDERQLTLRGRAYRAAFWTLVGYLCVTGGAQDLLDRSFFEPFVGEALGVVLAFTVFVLHCVFHDAYFAMNERADYYTRLFTFIMVLLIGTIVFNFLLGEPMMENGRLNFRAISLAVAVMYLAIVPAMRWKHKRDAGEEE